MSWREMQVLPQALPTWQILQQVCDVWVERAVGRAEWDEAAQRSLWRAEGNGWAAVLDEGDGDCAKAAGVSDRKIVRIAKVRSMGSVLERP
jgi:hypothetical protein